MDWRNAFVLCVFVLIIRRGWSTELLPPSRVEVKSSVLLWAPSGYGSSVTYTVQYSSLQEQNWHTVCGCSQTQFNFTTAEVDFYGKIFRVRAERANQTSTWQQSDQIQCHHTDTCAPLLNVTLQNNKVFLWMNHKDKTLKEEFGRQISFRILYWKETSSGDKQENFSNSNSVTIEGLETGQKYCFQAEYLAYKKAYGTRSNMLCKMIPETPTQKNLYIIISGMLILAGLVFFGICLYMVYKNSKKIKAFLHPPFDIPDHYQEFFSGEFSCHKHIFPSSQEQELDNHITIVSEETQEEEVM